MTRRPRVALVTSAVLGLVAGMAVTLAVSGPSHDDAGTVPATAGPSSASATGDARSSTSPPADDERTSSTTLLAWTSGGLPDGFGRAVAALDVVGDATVVSGDQTDMVRSTRSDGTVVDDVDDGWVIPLDTIAIDPSTFGAFVSPPARAVVGALQPGEALVTEASLGIRRLDVGSTIDLAGGPVTIVAVVDDVSGAGSELIVHHHDAARLGVGTERYVLVEHPPGERQAASRAIADLAGSGSVRFRTPTETTWLRHGDAVTPQVFVKAAFGEFSFREGSGRDVEIDPAWVESHIVEETVPILGPVRCHRRIIEPLASALASLADENLSHLVDPAAYAGCWAPRRIEAGSALSRHSWGIAVDLNIDGNPRGSFSTQDARLVEAMRSAGFTWGGLWLVPDPGHYELVPPD